MGLYQCQYAGHDIYTVVLQYVVFRENWAKCRTFYIFTFLKTACECMISINFWIWKKSKRGRIRNIEDTGQIKSLTI